jgi:hypothetical protein
MPVGTLRLRYHLLSAVKDQVYGGRQRVPVYDIKELPSPLMTISHEKYHYAEHTGRRIPAPSYQTHISQIGDHVQRIQTEDRNTVFEVPAPKK